MRERVGGKSGSGSGLFLMEMIVVVFFFVICASQCILAFATSERMSRQGKDLNRAVIQAESVMETWKAEGEDGLTGRLHFTRQEAPSEDGAVVYVADLDEDWQWVEPGRNVPLPGYLWPHVAELHLKEGEDGLTEAVLTVCNQAGIVQSMVPVSYRGEAAGLLPESGGDVVYVLEAKKYTGRQQ